MQEPTIKQVSRHEASPYQLGARSMERGDNAKRNLGSQAHPHRIITLCSLLLAPR